jgi:hypothetical protein
MKYVIKENQLEKIIQKYIDKKFTNLTCKVSPDEVVWYKGTNPIAKVSKDNRRYLYIDKNEFELLLSLFSIEWTIQTDDMLRELIIPYLTFDGGSKAIPILQELGFIDKLTSIALPYKI